MFYEILRSKFACDMILAVFLTFFVNSARAGIIMKPQDVKFFQSNSCDNEKFRYFVRQRL